VEFEFSSVRWAKLSNREKVALCEQYAAEAERLGHDAVAKEWRRLAAEIGQAGGLDRGATP
jgi:hypothetical protein